MTKRVADLLADLCGAPDHPLVPDLRRWAEDSRPFLAFAQAHAPKIRKKVRHAGAGDELADLRAELAVAAFLLRDRRFAVQYEPTPVGGGRGPDFRVVYKTHSPFHVEVTRLRLSAGSGPAETVPRLARVLCDKIGQFPPGVPGLLAVVLPTGAGDETLVPGAVRLLEGALQAGMAPPYPGWRPEDVRAFLRLRPRLGAVVTCSLSGDGDLADRRLWSHPRARPPLPPEVVQSFAPAR